MRLGLAKLKNAVFSTHRCPCLWAAKLTLYSAALVLLVGCGAPLADSPPPTPAAAVLTPLLSPSPTLSATALPASPSPTAAAVPTLLPTSTPAPEVCSPLAGMALAELPEAVSNPFHPPPAGSDDPHQGVDLADLGSDGNRIARAGLPVHAALPGQVAAVITDRFPYGNALITETSLDLLPWLPISELPLPEPILQPLTPLTCPPASKEPGWNSTAYSLYLLYAHMQDAPTFEMGEQVSCGQEIGRIGDSGNALNPHLHLEARLGPAGARFGSLAHYTSAASVEEMADYCIWRISGSFRAFEPLILFTGK